MTKRMAIVTSRSHVTSKVFPLQTPISEILGWNKGWPVKVSTVEVEDDNPDG